MTTFKAERLLIRVEYGVDFDPNNGVNAEEFAFITVCDQNAHDRSLLADYAVAPHDQPRWFPASEGLATVRAVISEKEAELGSADPERKAWLKNQIAILRTVEDRLDWIDLKDQRFHFLARDRAETVVHSD